MTTPLVTAANEIMRDLAGIPPAERAGRYRLRQRHRLVPPPTRRRRLVHQRTDEEHHAASGVTYRTYADGYVVTYGRVRTVTTVPDQLPRDWVVTVWTAHPLLVPRRAHVVRHLANHVTYPEALATADVWERSEEEA